VGMNLAMSRFSKGDDYSKFREINSSCKKNSVLIYRKTGGLGDLICMKPSIEQLTQDAIQVALDLPKMYHFLFRGIKRLRLVENEWERMKPDYGVFINAYCPCGTHEALTLWRPTKNRIDNFADLFNVAPVKPVLNMGTKKRFFEYRDKKIIGIQLEGANITKTPSMNFMREICGLLGTIGHVVTFDQSKKIAGVNSYMSESVEDIVRFIYNNVDVMIAPDSGLMHVALAMGIPTVCIFGPTNGKLTLKYYNNYTLIQKMSPDRCFKPCYYADNNNFKCRGKVGKCIDEIGVNEIYNAVFSLLGLSEAVFN
jgi:hypothetical protein